jgi:hypothetical protein
VLEDQGCERKLSPAFSDGKTFEGQSDPALICGLHPHSTAEFNIEIIGVGVGVGVGVGGGGLSP